MNTDLGWKMFEFIEFNPQRRTLRARDHVTHARDILKLLCRIIIDAYNFLVHTFWQEFFIIFVSYHVFCRFSRLIYSD